MLAHMPLFLNASDLAIYKLEMDFSYCLKFCVCIRCTGVAAVYQFDLFYLNKKKPPVIYARDIDDFKQRYSNVVSTT